MVVFVDLDRDDSFSEHHHHGSAPSLEKPFPPKLTVAPIVTAKSAELLPSPTSSEDDREVDSAISLPNQAPDVDNPNRNSFSAALSCYPYVDPWRDRSSPRNPSRH
jgi:hypothetical protein